MVDGEDRRLRGRGHSRGEPGEQEDGREGIHAARGDELIEARPRALVERGQERPQGRERNIALGAWGAVGGFGAVAGVLLGGILTDALSWEWIFFLNVPIGTVALLLCRTFAAVLAQP